jgi:hypothetical protein
MKPAYIRTAMLLVCLLFVPAVRAQGPETTNGTGSSSAPSDSLAVVPMLIEFTGNLLDRDNRSMTGPVGVTFALYAEQSGGAALWMETQNVHPDANGNYTVLLGAASRGGLPAEQFATGKARWLGLQVENQAERSRVMLVSVPYALKAGDAATLGGLPPSAFQSGSNRGTASSSALLADAIASNVEVPVNTVLSSAKGTQQTMPQTSQPSAKESPSDFFVIDSLGKTMGPVISVSQLGNVATVAFSFRGKTLLVEVQRNSFELNILFFRSANCTGQPYQDASSSPFSASTVAGPGNTLYAESGPAQSITAASGLAPASGCFQTSIRLNDAVPMAPAINLNMFTPPFRIGSKK